VLGSVSRIWTRFEAILTEIVVADATHGRLALERAPLDELPECNCESGALVRPAAVGVHARDRAAHSQRAARVTGFGGRAAQAGEIVAYWPALVDKRMVEPRVEMVEV